MADKYFFISDIHIDFWLDEWNLKTEETFTRFYENFMCPADRIVIAGDISNDYKNYVSFVKFISKKYSQVYISMGNHDGCVKGHTFGNGNPFSDTFEKFEKIYKDFEKITNVHFLDKEKIVDGIGGCMGMCDFSWSSALDFGGPEMRVLSWKKSWFDSRVWFMKEFSKDGWSVEPMLVWEKYKKEMMDIVKNKPKIMVTHFCPTQLGFQREFESSPSTSYFYFDGKDFLEEMPNDSYWVCGHIHGKIKTDYVNSKGNVIHIMSVPSGYPFEAPSLVQGIKATDCVFEL